MWSQELSCSFVSKAGCLRRNPNEAAGYRSERRHVHGAGVLERLVERVLHRDVPRGCVALRGAEACAGLVGTLLCLEDEVPALEQIDKADRLLSPFVRDGNRLLEDVRVAFGIGGGGVGRIDVEDLTEVDDERLRIRPLGRRGVTPFGEEFGRSQLGAVYRKEVGAECLAPAGQRYGR